METTQLIEDIHLGGQPSKAELQKLASEGYQAIVNFRTQAEIQQGLTPSQEGDEARDLGLVYLHLPVAVEGLHKDDVDTFCAEFRDLPRPVLLHCATGMRAGAMVTMALALEHGWGGEEALERAHQMGFDCKTEGLRTFITEYINAHQTLPYP